MALEMNVRIRGRIRIKNERGEDVETPIDLNPTDARVAIEAAASRVKSVADAPVSFTTVTTANECLVALDSNIPVGVDLDDDTLTGTLLIIMNRHKGNLAVAPSGADPVAALRVEASTGTTRAKVLAWGNRER